MDGGIVFCRDCRLSSRRPRLEPPQKDPGALAQPGIRVRSEIKLDFADSAGECLEGGQEQRIDADANLPSGDPHVRLFEEINGFILMKLGEPGFSAREIADAHFISVSLLYTLFNNLAGCNPGEYIRKLRINQARKLLDSRELLVSEVADRCGFSSPAIFSRCFKRETGVSPIEYLRSRTGK